MKYTHIIKPNIKHIYIKVNKDNSVLLISSKKMSKEALKVLEDKKEWIKKVKEKNRLRLKRDNVYKNEGVVYLFSKPYKLIFISAKKESIILEKNCIFYYSKCHTNPKKAIENFYKQELKNYIEPRVQYFAKKLSLFPKEIRYRKMKRRLGSCSYDNILTFNSMLAKLSLDKIDYVVVHELLHIKYKNHSPSFWKEVAYIFPHYKEIRKDITFCSF